MPRALQRSCLLLFAACFACAAPDLPIPEDQAARDKWAEVLDTVWSTAKPHVAFCLGNKEAGVVKTVLESFPDPLPTESAAEPVCSNVSQLARQFCGPKSLMEYYKVAGRKQKPCMILHGKFAGAKCLCLIPNQI